MTTETYFEPRVLWDLVGHTYDPQSVAFDKRVSFDRQHLRNTEECPMQITHMLVDPIDYVFEAASDDYGTAYINDAYNYRAAVLNTLQLSIMMPGRQYFTPDFTTLAALGAIRSWEPATAPLDYNQLSAGGNPGLRTAARVNTLRWDFPMAMRVPDHTRYEFALSSYAISDIFDEINGGAYTSPDVHAWISFYEEVAGDKGSFPWPGMLIQSDELEILASEVKPFIELIGSDPDTDVSATLTNNELQRWPGGSRHYTDRLNREVDTRLRGFVVSIDQYAYDLVLQANISGGLGADNMIIASLASKLATKARLVGMGTARKFWRDGAPLSLVCPSATPAAVIPFDQPITLMPGDSIDVEAEFPISGITANLGISFAGFLTQPKEK